MDLCFRYPMSLQKQSLSVQDRNSQHSLLLFLVQDVHSNSLLYFVPRHHQQSLDLWIMFTQDCEFLPGVFRAADLGQEVP